MNYLVIGADGREYGPVDLATLAEWAKADRVRPNSQLKEFDSGRVLTAAQVPGLFQAPTVPVPVPQPAPQPTWQAANYADNAPQMRYAGEGGSLLAWAFIDGALAIAMFFFLGGIGLIFGVFGVVNGFRAKQAGHPAALVAIIFAFLALGAVVAGWAVRLSGTPSP